MTLQERALETLNRIHALGSEGRPGFVWPDFSHEVDRIKFLTEHLDDDTIAEMFAHAYGFKLPQSFLDSYEEEDYREYEVGDTIMLTIREVNKKGVVFNQDSFKETITCTANLYQYPKFREWLPTQPIECKIVAKTVNQITVDPFAGMLDSWIASHTTDLQNQYSLVEDNSVTVSSLRLTRGGYLGRVRIDTISDFCGKDVYFEAFIPGSHIVLNIESDFNRWIGHSVKAFVTNYMTKPNSTAMTLICSVKEWLKFNGNQLMIEWFKAYTENNENWNHIKNTVREGRITGVCHTQNKCGVFVELPDDCLTGMINCTPDKLTSYHRGDSIDVVIDKFDEPMKYNPDVDQMQHIEPYVIEDNILKKCNIRLILAEAQL